MFDNLFDRDRLTGYAALAVTAAIVVMALPFLALGLLLAAAFLLAILASMALARLYRRGVSWWRSSALHVLRRMNERGLLLAAYHPHDSLTWLWGLWWFPYRASEPRWRLSLFRHGHQSTILLPLIGKIEWQTQERMPDPRRRKGVALGALAVMLALVAMPAFADTTQVIGVVASAPVYTASFQAILTEIVIPFLGALVAIAGPPLAIKLFTWLHVKTTAAQQSMLDNVFAAAASALTHYAAAAPASFQTHDQRLAAIINYVNTNAPPLLKKTGLTPEQMASRAASALGVASASLPPAVPAAA